LEQKRKASPAVKGLMGTDVWVVVGAVGLKCEGKKKKVGVND